MSSHCNVDDDPTDTEFDFKDDTASSISTLTDNANNLRQAQHANHGEQQQQEEDVALDKAAVAAQDTCWDGCWLANGLHGMFLELPLYNPHEDQHGQEQSNNNNNNDDDNYIALDMDQQDESAWEHLYVEILEPQKLQIAAGVIRRVAEGTYRGRLPVRALVHHEAQFQALAHAGIKAAAKGKPKKALAKYAAALQLVPKDFFVAPADQMQSVAELLAHQAAAYLQLHKFQRAGAAATAALLLVGNQVPARTSRAAAAVALQSTPHLIQAALDVEEVLHNGDQPTAEQQQHAQQQLQTIQALLETKKAEFVKENPNANWEEWVESIQQKCW